MENDASIYSGRPSGVMAKEIFAFIGYAVTIVIALFVIVGVAIRLFVKNPFSNNQHKAP